MKWSASLALAFVTAAMTLHTTASATDPPKKCYLIFPIRTELQRKYLFDENEQYLLLIHGNSLISANGQIDASKLDFDDLSRDVGPIIRIKHRGVAIRCDLIFAKEPPRAAARLVNLAAVGWAREQGYDRHVQSTTIGDRDWKDAVRLTNDARGLYEEENEENAVGDDTVKVYPVRTALSRLRTREAACVVSFPRPLDKDATGAVDDKTKAKIKELVASLKLKGIKRVQFGIRQKLSTDARKAFDQFRKKTARELAEALGVEDYSVFHAYVE